MGRPSEFDFGMRYQKHPQIQSVFYCAGGQVVLSLQDGQGRQAAEPRTWIAIPGARSGEEEHISFD